MQAINHYIIITTTTTNTSFSHCMIIIITIYTTNFSNCMIVIITTYFSKAITSIHKLSPFDHKYFHYCGHPGIYIIVYCTNYPVHATLAQLLPSLVRLSMGPRKMCAPSILERAIKLILGHPNGFKQTVYYRGY